MKFYIISLRDTFFPQKKKKNKRIQFNYFRSFYQKLVRVQDNFTKGDYEKTILDCLGKILFIDKLCLVVTLPRVLGGLFKCKSESNERLKFLHLSQYLCIFIAIKKHNLYALYKNNRFYQNKIISNV